MSPGKSRCHDVRVLGTKIIVCAKNMQHFGLFRDHIRREHDVYQMIRRSFQKDSGTLKSFVDIGSNHGIMSFFAFKNGATSVIAVEPNHFLSRLILRGFQRNKMPDAELFNAACIDAKTNETVKLKDQHIAEGAIGTVVRNRKHKSSTSKSSSSRSSSSKEWSIPAAPVAGFLPPNGGVVGVLKIDVEGHELSVMKSLVAALDSGGGKGGWEIENVVIEFGPPSRWRQSSAEYTAASAVSIMSSLRNHGYEIHVMSSFAYGSFAKRSHSIQDNPIGMREKKYGLQVDPLANGDWSVMDAMSECNCEAYLWLYKPSNDTVRRTHHVSMYSAVASTGRHGWYWFWQSGGWMTICGGCLLSSLFACWKSGWCLCESFDDDEEGPVEGGFMDSYGRRRVYNPKTINRR